MGAAETRPTHLKPWARGHRCRAEAWAPAMGLERQEGGWPPALPPADCRAPCPPPAPPGPSSSGCLRLRAPSVCVGGRCAGPPAELHAVWCCQPLPRGGGGAVPARRPGPSRLRWLPPRVDVTTRGCERHWGRQRLADRVGAPKSITPAPDVYGGRHCLFRKRSALFSNCSRPGRNS